MIKEKCLITDCTGLSKTRGLCGNCYQSALLNVIKTGKSNWEELESKGLSKTGKRGTSARGLWLLEFEKKTK